MKHLKTLVMLGIVAAMALAAASTANAATSAFTCSVSGTYTESTNTGKWSATCTSSEGNCKGSGTINADGTISGTCNGSSIFGTMRCSVAGNWTADETANTGSMTMNTTCRAGLVTAQCTASGSGAYNNRGAFKSTLNGQCVY